MTILAGLWEVLNSPVGVALVAGLTLWLLNRIYAAKPGWQKYEGAIITAIKLAEKHIPDDTPGAGMRRLDEAMQYVLKIRRSMVSKDATVKDFATIREGIGIIHAKLERDGNLGDKPIIIQHEGGPQEPPENIET